MPRGPADRPIRAGDDEVALQAAMRQALERGAVPAMPGRAPESDPPAFGGQVAQAAPVRAATAVTRHKGARSFVLVKAKRKGRKEHDRVPDPRGRGGTLDVNV